MAAPMIEQFPKGKLNNCWHYIELCKFVHPELTEEELPTEHFDLEKAIIDCRLDYV
mgnify:CR=1 FL=1